MAKRDATLTMFKSGIRLNLGQPIGQPYPTNGSFNSKTVHKLNIKFMGVKVSKMAIVYVALLKKLPKDPIWSEKRGSVTSVTFLMLLLILMPSLFIRSML